MGKSADRDAASLHHCRNYQRREVFSRPDRQSPVLADRHAIDIDAISDRDQLWVMGGSGRGKGREHQTSKGAVAEASMEQELFSRS